MEYGMSTIIGPDDVKVDGRSIFARGERVEPKPDPVFVMREHYGDGSGRVDVNLVLGSHAEPETYEEIMSIPIGGRMNFTTFEDVERTALEVYIDAAPNGTWSWWSEAPNKAGPSTDWSTRGEAERAALLWAAHKLGYGAASTTVML